MAVDEKYMAQCIELAQKGAGYVSPNPMVGSVIVHNGKVIGEGYHKRYGEAHAEVHAIQSVKDQDLLKESTIYVSLEPCSHHGKTPPCADLIISKKIPRVVIGVIDPFDKVAGKGVEKLKNAGLDVTMGVLEEQCKELNKRFFTFYQKKRPYIILKWAQTKDGFIDVERGSGQYGKPTWITNKQARKYVHKTRAEEDAIMVGRVTALKDNPSLTTRDWEGKNPTRVVLDRELKLPATLNLFNSSTPTIVFNSIKTEKSDNIFYKKLEYDGKIIFKIMKHLYEKEIQSLIVEGGSKTISAFINANLWDEAHVYEGPVFFEKGVQAPIINGKVISTLHFEGSTLQIIKNQD